MLQIKYLLIKQTDRIDKLDKKLEDCIIDASNMFRDVFKEFSKKANKEDLENIKNEKCS